MPTASADETVEGPDPEGLNRSLRNTRALEEFAQSMSEDLIQSFKSQIETLGAEGECLAFRFNQNQEVFAEEFASAVMEVALREGASGSTVQGSAGGKTDGGAPGDRPFVDESDIEGSPGREDPQDCHPGLPAGASIDSPSAPPTTPLLPEDSVRRGRIGERVAADSHLHLLARRLAGTIITSSLDEAQALGDFTSQ